MISSVEAPRTLTMERNPQFQTVKDAGADEVADAGVDKITLTESFLKTDLGAEFDFVGSSLSDPQWFGRGEGIAVRKGNTDLLARLNRALRQIRADGTYEEIRTKYFDYDIYGDAVSLTQPLEDAGR